MTKRWLGVLILLVTTLVIAERVCTQNNSADAETLIEVLRLQPGSVVAEIGAGNGALTLAVARHVGDSGRVLTTELGSSQVDRLRQAVERAGNVEVIEGQERTANLPSGCCDAVFMRNVYHHFSDPSSINASLMSALRPGGRIAVIDFPPRGNNATAAPGDRGDRGAHGVDAATVHKELEAAGFSIVATTDRGNRWFLVVAEKPR